MNKSQKMNIRSFNIKDQDQVIKLWKQCGLVVPQNDPKKDIERKLKVGADLFLVGELGGNIISTVMGGYEGHRGWINYLAVSPIFQGNGYGQIIMEVIEFRLKERNCPKINLQVRENNSAVLGFYKSLGYTKDNVVGLGKKIEGITAGNSTIDTLIVIDMQVASFKQSQRFDEEGVVYRINKLAEYMRNNNGRVIFIQHNGTREDGLMPDTPGWEILPTINIENNDIIVQKTICDSFYNTNLSSILRNLSCERTIITGCATDFCVDTTVRSAISNGFHVVIAADCHTTADRPHLKADKIIEHHNWVWSELNTPNKKTKVLPYTDIIV